MKLYTRLSKINFLKNRYAAKFLFVAFLGILIPVVILLYSTIHLRQYLAPLDLFLLALFLIAIGTVVVVLLFKNLLSPIIKGAAALVEYETILKVPSLPLDYTDEAGIILKNIQSLVLTNQRLLADKKELCEVLTTDLRDKTLQTEVLLNEIVKESTSNEIKKLAFEATESLHKQINFVNNYVEILAQEELINKQPIKVRKVNVQELLDEIKLKRKAALEAKNIQLTFNLKYARIRLKVSNSLFFEALGYVIDNAIKHAPENSKIEVTTEKSRGKLVLQVKDYGIGFNARQAEKIFSKFQTLEAGDSYAPLTGIYLAGQIIERFGGSIVAESDGLNQGARFIIELKLQR